MSATKIPDYVQAALRGLTKAQKRAVTAGYIGDDSMVVVEALMRKHLFYLKIDSPNGRWGTAELTPLGITVQTILKARTLRPGVKATSEGGGDSAQQPAPTDA